MQVSAELEEETMTRIGPCRCLPMLAGGHDTLELFTEGDALYEAMLGSIAGARRRAWLETYIFTDDEIGRRFAEALAERARAGLDVRLHIDAAGSALRFSTRLEHYLRAQGVQLRWFHRWHWRAPLRYNRRNHRKLLVVDDAKAYLGGFNIHRENSRLIYGERRWRDSHVRCDGALAVQAARLFDAFWRGNRRWALPRTLGTATVLMPNHTRLCRRQLRCAYAAVAEGAKSVMWVTTPYFVPDHRTQEALIAAARRGRDVRVLVPRKGDVRLARWAARAAYANLLRAGVRIFEYLPRVLHAKTAVVDETYAILGTANLDYRSFFLNYELNLITREPDLCRRLVEWFEKDLEEAEEIYAGRWAARPWIEHLAETVGWLARRWL